MFGHNGCLRRRRHVAVIYVLKVLPLVPLPPQRATRMHPICTVVTRQPHMATHSRQVVHRLMAVMPL